MSIAWIIKILSVIVEYGMLLILIFFVLGVARNMTYGLRTASARVKKPRGHKAIVNVVDARGTSLMGKSFPFTGELTMGRAPDNDVVIPGNFVSHHHAVISLKGNLYILEDLGSKNHTFLNDRILIGHRPLKSGDKIRIGFLVMEFEEESH